MELDCRNCRPVKTLYYTKEYVRWKWELEIVGNDKWPSITFQEYPRNFDNKQLYEADIEGDYPCKANLSDSKYWIWMIVNKKANVN